ncbi:MAG: site-2 protease family protein [Bdellovibrionota bacterium]|nr:site-2 protease family protein [Deltaproteobacteria bacterium]
MAEKLSTLVLWMVPFIFSLSFHEFAHAWVARYFGDNTAEMMGRVSMNPKAHIDPIGTIAFPVIGFLTGFPIIGWAKPVPVNSRNLKNPIKQNMWIAAAGPASNLLLAIAFTICLAIYTQVSHINTLPTLSMTAPQSNPIAMMLLFGVYLNVLLAFFNLLPMPPLDGGHVLRGLIPSLSPQLDLIERYGFIILLLLLYTGILRILLIPAFLIIQLLLSFV